MLNRAALISPELQSAIVREPLFLHPDRPVMEAITGMSAVQTGCQIPNPTDSQLDDLHLEARSSAVLVVEEGKLLGILTERDIVRLYAQQQPLDGLAIREVMSQPVVTLHEAACSNWFFVINLLQQYQIRYLPILDAQDRPMGLVTHTSLWQTTCADLLRLRLVSEVMTQAVICAAPDSSMLAIAQQMAEHRVGSVVIVQAGDCQVAPLQIPVGIVTERDILQVQALGLNLETCRAQTVMAPVPGVRADESLAVVSQIMQHSVQRLVVTDAQGNLAGIVTQTSLLQALNPLELYRLAKDLDKKVLRLEAEKGQLLADHALQLEQQVNARTVALQIKTEREQLVTKIATQLRSSLSLQTIPTCKYSVGQAT